MAQAQPPAVVLLDLCMPGCNGCNLAQDLRQLPDMSHAILICVTGYTSESSREQSLKAGCDHYMVKPTEWPELLGAISQLLAQDAQKANCRKLLVRCKIK